MSNIDDGLVLHLKLNEIDPETKKVPDSSSSKKDGTAQGDVSLVSDAQFGTCLQFDGTDDQVSVDAEAFRPIANTFTITAWVIPGSTHQIDPESTGGVEGTGGQRFMIYPPQGDVTYGEVQGHASAGISVGTNGITVYEHAGYYMPPLLVWEKPTDDPRFTNILTADSWTHIAVVYQDKTPSLYVNGQYIKTGLTSPKSLIHPSAELGGGYWGHFPGKIANVRVYQQALSAAKIPQVIQGDLSFGSASVVEVTQNKIDEVAKSVGVPDMRGMMGSIEDQDPFPM